MIPGNVSRQDLTPFSVWAEISLVDTRAFNACYYLSLRNPKVKARLQKMYQRFREYLIHEITLYRDEGLIPSTDPGKDANIIIAFVEGLSFYRNISGGKKKYKELGEYLKLRTLSLLNKEDGYHDRPGSAYMIAGSPRHAIRRSDPMITSPGTRSSDWSPATKGFIAVSRGGITDGHEIDCQ